MFRLYLRECSESLPALTSNRLATVCCRCRGRLRYLEGGLFFTHVNFQFSCAVKQMHIEDTEPNMVKYSIVELHRRLNKIKTVEDLQKSKDYISRVIYTLDPDLDIETKLQNAIESLNPDCESEVCVLKDWIFHTAADSSKLSNRSLYQYIAKTYLLEHIGIMDTFSNFYAKFIEWVKTEGDPNSSLTKSAVSGLLGILGIKTINKKVEKKTTAYLDVTHEHLESTY